MKTPFWLKKLYPNCCWEMPADSNKIYLSFDDGPHPEITNFILDQLQIWKAKASFFCIGKNVVAYPEIYRRILDDGHAVGNHSFNHLNGWKVKDEDYLADIQQASQYIDSRLFRPPYGRISRFQLKQLEKPAFNLQTIMWTVLSGDFDTKLNKEACLQNVLLHTKPGSIVVFHDSEKAREKIMYALPLVLAYFSEKGVGFDRL